MTDQQTEFYVLNESSLTVVFGDTISAELAEKVLSFDRALHARPFEGFITTIPAYATLTVCYNPNTIIKGALKGASVFDKVSTYLSSLPVEGVQRGFPKREIIIPVCYGGSYGPDLAAVAAHGNLAEEEVISLHSALSYTVYMIGFVPGFAYMGGMDLRLSSPRKEQPRSKVPAGSVGIAGKQTGIYPLDIPGGWQIIGQTPLRLFDATRHAPSLLMAGDQVIFKPISVQEFQSLLT